MKQLFIFPFWWQHRGEWQDFDMAVDPCGDQMQEMSRLFVFVVDLTSSVHYHVELVKFLVKQPNFISVKSYNLKPFKRA